MKKVFLILIIGTTFFNVFGQEKISKQNQIDSLTKEIETLEIRKSQIEKSIEILENEVKKILANQAKNQISFGGYTGIISSNKTPVFKESEGTNVIKTLNNGDSILIVGYKNGKLFINDLELYGFIHPIWVKQDSLISSFVEREKEEEFIKAELEKSELEESREKAYQQRQSEISARRIKNIKSRFSEEIAQKIIDRKIWIGMTSEMAILSIGYPKDINRTVTAYSTREQWVYENRYLYFENRILATFQD